MSHRRSAVTRLRRLVLMAAVCGPMVCGGAAQAANDSDTGAATGCPSLKLVPESAAYYTAMLRGREQYDAVVGSHAWVQLKALPVVQMGVALYNIQAANPETPLGKIQAACQDPAGQKLLEFGGDMFSHEVFSYGEPSAVDALQLVQRVVGAMRYGPLMLQMSQKTEGMSQPDQEAMLILKVLSENLPLLKVPEMVAGFKISNLALAKEELQELEKRATAELEKYPLLKGRLTKTTVAGHEYLTLALDGQMIPWDKVPVERFKEAAHGQADVEKLLARIKELKLVVAIGLRDDYLLVSIGGSTDALARLGMGPSLAQRPELAPVHRFARKRLTSVQYLSQAVAQRLMNQKEDVDKFVAAVPKLLRTSGLSEAQQAEIRGDVEKLVQDLQPYWPQPGPATSVSFLAPEGLESFQYDWGQQPAIDSSKPLGLLEHLGGSPALAVVVRGKHSLAPYDLLVKWLGVAYRYVEKYAVPKMEDRERREFQQFTAKAIPVFQHLNDVNRAMLWPALADAQAAVVLDTKFRSKQFAEALPKTDKAMPMIEPALVLGVSDAALLRKACHEYRAALDALVEAAKQVEDSKVPKDFKIPAPEVIAGQGGTIYAYALPKQWGVNQRVVPNVGLSEHVAVLSTSRRHTERLLAATPLTVDGRRVKTDRPLAAASVLDVAGLIDAAAPWVDYAAEAIARSQGDGSGNNSASILDQVHVVIRVLKVCRSVTAEVYQQGKATVTHAHVEIHDVE